MRLWCCHTGKLVELGDDVPLTMYDGLNHRIMETSPHAQMITGCGKRACPHPKLREVPARGPVDCFGCIETDPAWRVEPVALFGSYERPLRADTGSIAFTMPVVCPICDHPTNGIARGEVWINRDEGRVIANAERCMHLIELSRGRA